MDRNLTESSTTTKQKTKDDYWRSQIAAYYQSGLSMRIFCQQQQLSFHPFRYQLYRLRDIHATTQKSVPTPKLIPVNVVDNKVRQPIQDRNFHFSYQDGQLGLQCSGLVDNQVSSLITLIGDWYAQPQHGA